MKFIAEPFIKDDMERPADEGRSLHDLANKFYRDKMGLAIPLAKQPKSAVVQKALKELKANKADEVFYQLLIDLQATPFVDLFGEEQEQHPPTAIGVLHHAANAIKPPSTDSSTKRKKGRVKGTKNWTS